MEPVRVPRLRTYQSVHVYLSIVVASILLFLLYLLISPPTIKPDQPQENNSSFLVVAEEVKSKPKRRIIVQPFCPISYLHVILSEIIQELHFKKAGCTPEDRYNLAKHEINPVTEPKGYFVIYIMVALLLASLAAAIVDVCKAKGQSIKSKPPLTKRCSLADLTVLRHSRKESMRRDSAMETEHRNSLKLLARPTSLHRRCSFPVGPGDFGSPASSRRTSLDEDLYCDFRHGHARLIRRH